MKAILGKFPNSDKISERILIDDDKIIAIDNERTVPDGVKVFDFGDKLVCPPFTDSHTHFFQTGLYMGALDVSGIATKDELLSFIRKQALDNFRIDEVVWLWGFDPIDDMPNSIELESAAPNVPIFLRRVDGHSCSLSQSALKMLPQNICTPNGIYSSSLQEKVVDYFLRMVGEDELIRAANRVAKFSAKVGAMRIHALVPYIEWAKILMRIQNNLPIETEIFVETTDVESVASLGLRQIGGCILLDGSFGSHTATSTEPYTDSPENRGILYFTDEELISFFRAALDKNLAVAMHAIGDRAIEQYIRCAEKVANGGKLNRWRIEHAELINRNQIERAKKLGLTLSVQPAFEKYWGGPNKMYAKRLGNRWKMTNHFRDEIDAGILLLGGSDSYITPIDPLAGIYSAMNHPNESQRLTQNEAISLFTDNPLKWNTNKYRIDISNLYKINDELKFIVLDRDFNKSIPKIFTEISGRNLF